MSYHRALGLVSHVAQGRHGKQESDGDENGGGDGDEEDVIGARLTSAEGNHLHFLFFIIFPHTFFHLSTTHPERRNASIHDSRAWMNMRFATSWPRLDAVTPFSLRETNWLIDQLCAWQKLCPFPVVAKMSLSGWMAWSYTVLIARLRGNAVFFYDESW